MLMHYGSVIVCSVLLVFFWYAKYLFEALVDSAIATKAKLDIIIYGNLSWHFSLFNELLQIGKIHRDGYRGKMHFGT